VDVLILGGTGFLSGEIALEALALGHDVTCLTRGVSGDPPSGAEHVLADREEGDAYLEVSARYWDEVVDTTSTPSYARAALEVLGDGVGHWTYVSSVSVYADLSQPGGNEADPIWDPLPLMADEADLSRYGELKSACEAAARDALGDRLVVVRPGLLIGPGDDSDRFGYWPGRFARGGQVLVPDTPELATQVLDARDLAAWIVDAFGRGDVGTYDAVGPVLRLADVLGVCASVADFSGRTYAADPEWLVAHDVDYWMGPDSLPLWLSADYVGMMARSGAAAVAAGLVRRPLEESALDVLADERRRGLDRERRAGLRPEREAELLIELLASAG
jgi:nucleoside-diphosphate-sugar epimerase